MCEHGDTLFHSLNEPHLCVYYFEGYNQIEISVVIDNLGKKKKKREMKIKIKLD